MKVDFNSVRPLSVFISSTGDLAEVRNAAKEIIDRLSHVNAFIRSNFRLDVYAYENVVPPLLGNSPQSIVNEYLVHPADVDIMICILWKSLGTPLRDPETGVAHLGGTAYELQKAYDTYRANGRRPIVLLYQCVLNSANAGFGPVDEFLRRFRLPGSGYEGVYDHRRFETTEQFRGYLEQDLRLILEKFDPPAPLPAPVTPRDQLAAKVHSIWISGFLRSSFEGEPPLAMEFRIRMPEPSGDTFATRLTTGLHLKTAFAKADQRMAIIAPAGLGKTIALVQLLSLLLDDALQAGDRKRIPVLFDASSWRAEFDFRDWIVQELDRIYSVGRTAALKLIGNNELIYMFDGLDHIPQAEGTSGTLEAANVPGSPTLVKWFANFRAFEKEVHGPGDAGKLPLCVASRPDGFDGAISAVPECANTILQIELLGASPELVLAYIDGRRELHGLSHAVRHDSALMSLAMRPLFLHLMLIAFRDQPTELINHRASEQDRSKDLIARYDERRLRALTHVGAKGPTFSLREIRLGLGWLAARQTRDIFLVELLQPSVFESQNRMTYRMAAATALALMLAIGIALPACVAASLEWSRSHGLGVGLGVGVWQFVMFFAFTLGIAVPAFAFGRSWKTGIALGFLFGLIRGIVVAQGSPNSPIPSGPWGGVVQSILTTIFASSIFAVTLSVYRYDIMSIDPLRSFSFSYRKGSIGLLAGLFAGALFWLTFGLARGIILGVAAWFPLFVILSLRTSGVQIPSMPNQAIVRSAATMLVSLILVPAIYASAAGVSYYAQTNDVNEALENSIRALSGGVLILFLGGIPVIQHFVLRLLAWRSGYVPLRLVAFLNFCADLMVLQRVGGAFKFKHDIIRQHYRRLWISEHGSPRDVEEQPRPISN